MSKLKQFLQYSINPDPYNYAIFLRLEMEIGRSCLECQSDQFHDKITWFHRISLFKNFLDHRDSAFSCRLFLFLIRFSFLLGNTFHIHISTHSILES